MKDIGLLLNLKKKLSIIIFISCTLLLMIEVKAQPSYDNCTGSSVVTISNGGYGIGTFTSNIVDITTATVQTGETFAPAILVAGQSQKSIWYKFTIPTTRAVRVTLAQSGNTITAGDVGFAVYRTNACLPGNTQISTKLTPIALFGNTYHPCVDSGEYFVQVSAKNSAKGQIFIQVETALPVAAYDQPKDAADYEVLAKGIRTMTFDVECQSIEDDTERCQGLGNNQQYNKSTWHVFKTPAYFDFIGLLLSHAVNTNNTFGLKIYEGDVRSLSYKTLPAVVSCDSFQTTGTYFSRKIFKCGILQPNKVYSVQIFYPQTFTSSVKLAMVLNGTAPTQAPVPTLSSMPSTNNLGKLKTSRNTELTQVRDYLSCNSRHSETGCGSALPKEGFVVRSHNWRYGLSTFFTFDLTTTANLTFNSYTGPYDCSGTYYLRVYKQAPSNNCTGLDTANIIAANFNTISLSCLPPGGYTVQVMGRDSALPENQYSYYSFSDGFSPYYSCFQSELGNQVLLNISAQEITGINRFSLNKPGAYDTIGAVNHTIKPLVSGTVYQATRDTFGCSPTVMPEDNTCAPGSNRAVFRQMLIPDSGLMFMGGSYHFARFYKGDANALAKAQNAFTFPAKITGLTPYNDCYQYGNCNNRVCIVPGTYTHVTFGNDNELTREAYHTFTFRTIASQFNSLSKAENLGTITNQKVSAVDFYDCKDNAISINGFQPCTDNNTKTTKAIYRTFYLAEEARVTISGYHYNNDCGWSNSGVMTLFYGKATDGEAALKPVGGKYQCFTNMSADQCDILPAGWYTLITYAGGTTYGEPLRNAQTFGGTDYAGRTSQVTISLSTTCPSPKYNRPVKAAIDTITKQPFLLQWGPRLGHTAAYPKTDTTITLYQENFNCIVDTPFLQQTLQVCDPSLVKAAFYVFRTTQEAFVQINTQHYWSAVYSGNARNGNMKFDSTNLIQPCIYGQSGSIQLNRLQPGTYTLVVFGRYDQTCHSVTPTLYIDRIGYSRFDHARNAYDFGVVPPDSLWHNGKVGDVNPLHKDRAPSDDFFYSTTGAMTTDPSDMSCGTEVYPAIYNTSNNTPLFQGNSSFYMPRRNLWYTFVIKDGGTVQVRVNSRTKGKTAVHRFAIYRSDADGSLSFANLIASGGVDSTRAQGLTLVAQNSTYYCYYNAPEVSFYREPCSPKPERYYLVVENVNEQNDFSMKPANQLDVEILVDSAIAIQPKYDHYSTAGTIGESLGAGKFTGPDDNFSCATRNAKDPIYSNYPCGNKTLWYKFTTNVTGNLRFRMVYRNGQQTQSLYSWTDIAVYREVISGDSTENGLKIINTSNQGVYIDGNYWGKQCISAGTYYILLTGCNRLNEWVYPEIEIIEQAGDFCSAPVVAALSGAGSKTVSTIIDCHTIGTDYGEFNPTLTCPNGAITDNYKTTWYRIDISGKDTLDVTTYLSENTTASPSDIKYRMMEGTCGAMQERSCVQDAQTQDTYKCLPPGSYYIQVFTPLFKNGIAVTGDISLNLSAVKHVDTCAPAKACLSTAVFLPQYDCTKSDAVSFTNLSTYGTNIQYQWDFGWNGQTSTAVSPLINYPALDVEKTYTVKLKVTNNNCPAGTQNTDETTSQITIPARPRVNLGRDTVLCNTGSTLTLNAETWSGATYRWSTGHTTPSVTFTSAGYPYDVWVEASYKGCIKRDTIRVAINAIKPQKQDVFLCREDSVQLSSHRGHNELHNWSTGETRYFMYAKTTGLYVNTIDWQGCTIRDSFTVIRAQQPFAASDTLVCSPFKSFKLNLTTPGASSYYWQNGSGSPEFTVNAPGTYWAQVSYPSCTFRDTIIVNQSPQAVVITKDTSLCEGQAYLAPWGQLLNKSGTYRDTVRYNGGCDSLVHTVNLKVVTTQTTRIDASICGGGTYSLPWGQVVSGAGLYRDTLRSRGGCDSVLRVVNLQVNQPVVNSISAAICQGQNFTLPWGKVVTTSGIYKDTLRHVAGCDSLIRVVELKVNPTLTQLTEAVICEGSSYTLLWGEVVTQSGRYLDVIRYASGCDSLVREVTVRVTTKTVQHTTASICENGRYRLPWGSEVSTAGVYRDTVRTAAGCDSLIRSVDLAVSTVARLTQTVPLCEGSTYTLPSGIVVQGTGTFVDTLRAVNGGCDSVIRTIYVTAQTKVTNRSNASICAGATYALPWGEKVSTAGTYRDTLRYPSGCDSLIQEVNLQVNAALTTTTDAGICSGEQYTLPWGDVVTTAGVYKDTIRYADGCDSLVQTVTLSVRSLTLTSTAASICSGETYALPWGGTVNTSGMYSDTLRYVAGCDSVIQRVDLQVRSPQVDAFSVSLCSGQTYTLPSGDVVSSAGVFKDTLRYQAGCDSVYRTITVLVNTPVVLDLAVSICEGSNYTLPSGTIVTAAGVYRDTVRQTAGCDSLYRTINLRIRTTQTKSTSASICDGESYVLPWGGTASVSGIFRDTLRYTEGCDSLIQVVELVVNKATRFSEKATICEGSTYTLPWGTSVSTAGIYRDTLRYATGCDSLIRQVDLLVNRTAVEQELIALCKGESFTLPWGPTVSASGTYSDTLRYISGCDSVRRSYVVSFGAALTTTEKPAICAGELYTLPWGPQVTTAGSYRDTLRTRAGCDSLIRIVDLQVKDVTTQHLSATICQGGSYTLAGGQVVSRAGTYRDTLHFVSGCDSIRRTITLRVEEPTTLRQAAVICGGDSYNLPWGPAVNTQGIYRDTLRYASGCDSVVREVDLVVLSKRVQASSAVVCEGQSYTLPWGERVTSSGIYQDTLHYQTGCDSLIRVVTVTVQKATTQALSPTICSGHSYTLPWGQAATTSGVYRDTLQYQSGCDSVIRVVNLTVTAPEVSTVNASICSDQWYTLPSGTQVNTTGVYRDTLRTSAGCDSILRTVNLEVRQAPVLALSKSNDVDCMLGTAKLQASGANSYTWSPATSLNNAGSHNPVASPTTTTVYSVKATATNGCSVDGSIEVKVTKGDPGKGYLVPTAFTPNGDGKNDCFSVRHWGVVQNFKMTVYNRWGEIVFQSTDVSRCWDGVYKSQREGSATFVYVITADTNCGQVLRKGYVNLIR